MFAFPRHLCAVALAILLTACGGSDGGSDPAAPVAGASPSPSPTPTSSGSAGTAPPTTWSAQAAALFNAQPSVSNCVSGTLKASVKDNFLNKLNALRALHNLPPVAYSGNEDAQEQDAALMMAIAKQLSHTPDASWPCYSASGAAGAGSSNLVGSWGSNLSVQDEDEYLALWMTEGGSSDIGHRRWILSPFLGKTSYGRVTVTLADGSRASAASMRVFRFNSDPAVPAGIPPFVAYPYGDYPQRYFGLTNYLSFTAISSTSSNWANQNVNFDKATISVSGPNGAMTVTDVSTDYQGYGVPNSIQWRVTGLQTGVSYKVTITGVSGAPQSSYSYSFRITA